MRNIIYLLNISMLFLMANFQIGYSQDLGKTLEVAVFFN